MIRHISILYIILLLLPIIGCNPVPAGNVLLFEKDSDDWISSGDATWTFEKGELIGSVNAGSGFVMTSLPYDDFEFELEFFPDSTINSGVFIRCREQNLSAEDCYELNIWDEHPNQDARTGAVVGRSTPLAHVRTIDRWNSYKVIGKGEHIEAWINGAKVVDLKSKDISTGYIGLQAAASGTIKFRNIRLKILED